MSEALISIGKQRGEYVLSVVQKDSHGVTHKVGVAVPRGSNLQEFMTQVSGLDFAIKESVKQAEGLYEHN